MKIKPLTLQVRPGATPISKEDALRFFGKEALASQTRRLEVKCVGPWQIPVSVKGLAATCTWKEGPTHKLIDTITLHGDRTLCQIREAGYELEGKVSLNGYKRRAFTSSMLFELPDKRLIDVAVLHVC